MEEKKKVQFHIPWKKIGLAFILAFFLTFGIMVLRFRMTYHDPTEVYHENVKHEFVWDGTTYRGTYDGDFQNTQPNGFGSFEDSEGRLKFTGLWQKGLFSGVGMITYDDGSIEAGEFTEGKRNGIIRSYENSSLSENEITKLTDKIKSIHEKVTRTETGDTYFNIYNDGMSLGLMLWEDGDIGDTFTETMYDENVPYARSDSYSDGQMVSAEYYINATPMSEMINEAKPLTAKLIDKEGYYNTYIYIDGVVEFAGETSTKSYIRFSTDAIGMAYCGYESTYGLTSEQVYAPNVKEGDKIRVYGYYMGLSSYNIYTDKDGNGNKFAKIMPFLVVKEEDFNQSAVSLDDNSETADTNSVNAVTDDYITVNGVAVKKCVKDGHVVSYEDIMENPYFYNMEKVEDTFVIKNVKKEGLTFTITACPENAPTELYTLIYEGDVMDKFLTGSKINITGFLAGQTKKVSTEKRDEMIEDGAESSKVMTYEFEKQLVIKVEEIQD